MAHSFAPPPPRRPRRNGGRVSLPTGLELTEADRDALGPVDTRRLRRSDLILLLSELEGCVRYMGSGHPLRDATRLRFDVLRDLLSRWDQAVAEKTR